MRGEIPVIKMKKFKQKATSLTNVNVISHAQLRHVSGGIIVIVDIFNGAPPPPPEPPTTPPTPETPGR